MDLQAILFDVNGTLIDILTDEGQEEIWTACRRVLSFQGMEIRRSDIRDRYYALLKEQQATCGEKYPEYDAVAIWRRIVDENQNDFSRALPPEKIAQLPLFLAEMFRGISRKQIKPYPNVIETLDALKSRFKLAIVTDAQTAWARAELHRVDLLGYFDPIIVSGDFGYRKPDSRLFQTALDRLKVAPENALFIGNDMHRDIYGAQQVGMKTVMYNSNQGDKSFPDTTPDHTIDDYKDVLAIVG